MAFIMVGTIILPSCKKYADGGSKGKAEKRIKISWKLESYYMDGVDATSGLLISGYIEEYKEDGSYVRSYTDSSGDAFSETGTWQFDSDKDQIKINGVSSLELSAQHSTVSTSDYDILKLKKDELWYSYSNGGSLHEFHLTPN